MCVVAHPAEEGVCDAGCAAGACGDFEGTGAVDFDFQESGGALDDVREFLLIVVVQAVDEAEAGAEGGCEHAGARGGTDEGETGEIDLDGAGGGAGIDDDVEAVVFHGRVEVFLDGGVEAVDLIDEEDVAFLDVREDAGEVSGFFNLWAGGCVHLGAGGIGY